MAERFSFSNFSDFLLTALILDYECACLMHLLLAWTVLACCVVMSLWISSRPSNGSHRLTLMSVRQPPALHFSLTHKDTHHAERHSADTHYADKHSADTHYADKHSADTHHARCRHTHHARCRHTHHADTHNAPWRHTPHADTHNAPCRHTLLWHKDVWCVVFCQCFHYVAFLIALTCFAGFEFYIFTKIKQMI